LAWVRLGDSKRAVADFARAIELNPGDREVWQWQAVALILLGQFDVYRELRNTSVHRFADTTDPNTAERFAKGFLILPGSGAELETAARMAQTAVNAPDDHPDMAWFRFARGLADYRLGQFGGAVDWMQKVLSGAGDVPQRDAEARFVLAMAEWHLQKAEEARVALAKGLDIVDANLPKHGSGDLGDDWIDWVIAHALLDEAKALIDGPAARAAK
jgi:Flp pilus assembly protein TadD